MGREKLAARVIAALRGNVLTKPQIAAELGIDSASSPASDGYNELGRTLDALRNIGDESLLTAIERDGTVLPAVDIALDRNGLRVAANGGEYVRYYPTVDEKALVAQGVLSLPRIINQALMDEALDRGYGTQGRLGGFPWLDRD